MERVGAICDTIGRSHVVALSPEHPCEARADETSPAGDEDSHVALPALRIAPTVETRQRLVADRFGVVSLGPIG